MSSQGSSTIVEDNRTVALAVICLRPVSSNVGFQEPAGAFPAGCGGGVRVVNLKLVLDEVLRGGAFISIGIRGEHEARGIGSDHLILWVRWSKGTSHLAKSMRSKIEGSVNHSGCC